MGDTIVKDTGCDPLLGGMFRMIPSGDIVDWDERVKRLPIIEIDRSIEEHLQPLIGGLNEMQVDLMQGGKMDIY